MGTSNAAFGVVLVAHVVCAVLGFGSILVTGCYAHLARPRGGAASEAVRRYFRPGPNAVSRLIFAVPVLGLALAGLGAGDDLARAWLWAGSALWTLAAVLAVGVLWPAEARIQALVASAPASAPPAELGRASRRASWAAAVIDVAFVAAMVLMVARPGG